MCDRMCWMSRKETDLPTSRPCRRCSRPRAKPASRSWKAETERSSPACLGTRCCSSAGRCRTSRSRRWVAGQRTSCWRCWRRRASPLEARSRCIERCAREPTRWRPPEQRESSVQCICSYCASPTTRVWPAVS